MTDEGPSGEDIERFGGDETGFCPSCGTEVWDDAPRCNSCGFWIEGGAAPRGSDEQDLRRRWKVIVVVLVLLGFLWWVVAALR